MQTMTTSFTVSQVTDEASLVQACSVRAQSYGHHLPSLRESFAEHDAMDESASCTTYLATDKFSGQAVGSLRIQLGAPGRPLMLEASYELAAGTAGSTRAELTRMSVLPGADPLVRLLLWKTGFYFCLANQVQCMVIGARRPALIRQYKGLGFTELTREPVVFAHAGGLPHSVLHFDVRSAERRWYQDSHELYRFMFNTHHPDMDVMGPRWRPGPSKAAQREAQRSLVQATTLPGASSAPNHLVSMA